MKTRDLIGDPLNYAVILAKFPKAFENKPSIKNIVVNYPYSTVWNLAGPIIEREKLELTYWHANPATLKWCSSTHQNLKYDERGDYINGSNFEHMGPTPLIAAMRCFVASKLGGEVDVPQELLATTT